MTWPDPIQRIYDRYREQVGLEAMHWGPAHIVWEDENFDDESIQFCIENPQYGRHLAPEQVEGVLESLRELQKVSVVVRTLAMGDV